MLLFVKCLLTFRKSHALRHIPLHTLSARVKSPSPIDSMLYSVQNAIDFCSYLMPFSQSLLSIEIFVSNYSRYADTIAQTQYYQIFKPLLFAI